MQSEFMMCADGCVNCADEMNNIRMVNGMRKSNRNKDIMDESVWYTKWKNNKEKQNTFSSTICYI